MRRLDEFEIIATIRRDQEKKYDSKDFEKRMDFLLGLGIRTFRINVGKWDESEFRLLCEDIEYNRKKNSSEKIKILLDIPYPGQKTRIITYGQKVNIRLKRSSHIHIYSANIEELSRIHEYEKALNHREIIIGISLPEIGKATKVHDRLIYADGEGEFEVNKIIDDRHIVVEPQNDFIIDNGKSISFLGSVQVHNMTNATLELIKRIEPDILALSFVENKRQLEEVRSQISMICSECKLMSKIENLEGVKNFEEILCATDSVMVARGDLCLNVPLEDFPKITEELVEKTVQAGKNVYVATGFMDTLENQYLPSRSDLIDLYSVFKSKANGAIFTYKIVRSSRFKVVTDIIHSWEERGISNGY